ncbi:MAG TPA: GIY-YIG nuclease family protein [Candidatus Paceibacterota bacterium]
MPITYILFSQKIDKFYVGASKNNDINFRLSYHNTSKVRSTKFGRPWAIVRVEPIMAYTDARKRELFLKSGVGRKWIAENFAHWKNK